MGVIMMDEQHVFINFFNSSNTFSNVKANKCAVANVVDDIEIFYKTSFKEANRDGKLPEQWFVPSENVNAPKLDHASASIDLRVKDLVPIDSEKTKVSFKVEAIHASPKFPKVYCRAMGATLEAIINATRVKHFITVEKERRQVTDLLEQIKSCNELVSKVAPNSQYSFIMSDLRRRIESWRHDQ